jgi:hypothetical protein
MNSSAHADNCHVPVYNIFMHGHVNRLLHHTGNNMLRIDAQRQGTLIMYDIRETWTTRLPAASVVPTNIERSPPGNGAHQNKATCFGEQSYLTLQ